MQVHAPMVVANATALQVAKAIEAVATVVCMFPDEEMQWRRDRLQALTEHEDFGGKAALGRALGFRDGAFVGQMLRGERPVTEKTIAQIEGLRGGKFADWFRRDRSRDQAPQAWPFKRITSDAWFALDEYERVAAEEAARDKLRELQAERGGPFAKQRAIAA